MDSVPLVSTSTAPPGTLERVGRPAAASVAQIGALLVFVGETALAFVSWAVQPQRIRWRPILFNIRMAQ